MEAVYSELERQRCGIVISLASDTLYKTCRCCVIHGKRRNHHTGGGEDATKLTWSKLMSFNQSLALLQVGKEEKNGRKNKRGDLYIAGSHCWSYFAYFAHEKITTLEARVGHPISESSRYEESSFLESLQPLFNGAIELFYSLKMGDNQCLLVTYWSPRQQGSLASWPLSFEFTTKLEYWH